MSCPRHDDDDFGLLRMARRLRLIAWLAMTGSVTAVGCAGPGRDVTWLSNADLDHYRDKHMHIVEPAGTEPPVARRVWEQPPRTITAPTEDAIRNLSLSEAFKMALENNPVIRSRGGFLSPGNAILGSPDRVASVWDPAIQETGVLFGGRGVTAALAAFDPEFTTTMTWGRNETPQNNSFLAGGIGSGQALVGETGNFTSRLRKQLGYGASLSVGHDWQYFGSNIPSAFNLYNSTYTGNVSVGYRQPLLAGSGTEFTQIAGPVANQFRGLSGVSQGVLIARINNDLTLTQFEQSAINLVKDVEDLYWDLYLAYRNWDAAVTSRNSAQKSWRDAKVILDGGGRQGFTQSDEPLARDRYFQARAQAESALSALYRAETALRRIIGLPPTDGTVLRPSDEPVTARLVPDWKANLVDALTHRVELRRHRWSIRSLELQLKAARSLVRPRLDLVGDYRVNALGDNLFSSDRSTPFASGYRGLSHADHTGWNLGVEFTVPLGMRSATAQVKNLELRLAKARAVQDAQEMEISHELADAIQQLAANEAATRSNLNRRASAQERVRQLEIEFTAGTRTLDDLLRAQVSRGDAEVAYYSSLVAYNQALTNLHYRTGQLLAVNNVQLAESEWTPAAYRDALRRAWERSHGLSGQGILDQQPAPQAEPGPAAQPEQAEASSELGPQDTTSDEEPVPKGLWTKWQSAMAPQTYQQPDESQPDESQGDEEPTVRTGEGEDAHGDGPVQDPVMQAGAVDPPSKTVSEPVIRAAYDKMIDRIQTRVRDWRDAAKQKAQESESEEALPSPGDRDEPAGKRLGKASRKTLAERIWRSKHSQQVPPSRTDLPDTGSGRSATSTLKRPTSQPVQQQLPQSSASQSPVADPSLIPRLPLPEPDVSNDLFVLPR